MADIKFYRITDKEFKAKEEEKILLERIERIEKDPVSTVSWKDIRRT